VPRPRRARPHPHLPAVERGRLPWLLYLHGGGFVVGGLDSHDDICAELADRSGLGVVAVDYRLAPEHRFPAAFDDCWAVLQALGDGSLGIEATASSSPATVPAAISPRPWPCAPATSAPRGLQGKS
jgi:acetyl esterase